MRENNGVQKTSPYLEFQKPLQLLGFLDLLTVYRKQ